MRKDEENKTCPMDRCIGPLQDGREPAEFDTEIEAARAYDHAANEFFKRLDKSKIDLEFGEYGTDIGIAEHSDDDAKSLTCDMCGSLVFTTFTFGGDRVEEKLCWYCFDRILTTDDWEQIGEVGVDSGQLMVCDPCYIDGEWEKEDYTGDDKPAKHAFSYNAVCQANMNWRCSATTLQARTSRRCCSVQQRHW